MTKKVKVNFWVQSSKSKKYEEVLLFGDEYWKGLTKEDQREIIEEWAPSVFPMFRFTDAHVNYGADILEEVNMTDFKLSMSHAGETAWHDKLIWVEFSTELPQGGEIGVVWEGEIIDHKIKKLLDFFPPGALSAMEISKEEFGFALRGEIAVAQAWEVIKHLQS